jgi:hypothetical protein
MYPSIAVDSNDYIHVVWQGRATGYTSQDQIWYVRYATVFETVTRISTYAGMETNLQQAPSISIDSDDNLHVVWEGYATGFTTGWQIWYAEYTTSWQTPVNLGTFAGMSTRDQLNPAITIDSIDHRHVVWSGFATGYETKYQVWYAEYTTSWQTPVRISTLTDMELYDQKGPDVAIDSSDHLHVVWYGKMTGYTTIYQIWYTKNSGTWGTPSRISDYDGMSTNSQVYPSVAVDTNDYLYVVWNGMATGYTDYDKVWYASFVSSWETPIVLQASGQNRYAVLRWSRYPTSNHVTTQFDYLFMEGTSSPYNIKFDMVVTPSPPAAPPAVPFPGIFLTRVLETKISKYSAHQLLSTNKEFLQSLGLKNRLFLIEALGTGSASAPMDRSVVENSALSIVGKDGFITTRLMTDPLPVTFLGVEITDQGGRPAELKIIIHAVERITGSA